VGEGSIHVALASACPAVSVDAAAPVRHRPVTVQRLAGATERMARMLWRDAAENQ